MPDSARQSKRKILFLTKWYPTRYDPQMGVFIRKHAQAVAKFYDVAVLHVFSDEHLREKKYELVATREYDLETVLVYFKKYPSSISILAKVVNFSRYCSATFTGLKYIRKNFGDHDITHAYILLRPALTAYFLKLFRRKPFVVSEQWSGFATGKYSRKNTLEKLLTKFIIKKADAVTVVSEFLKNQMIRNGLKTDFKVIHNIIESRHLQSNVLVGEKVKILVVADLVDEIKNVSGILRAVSEIVSSQKNIELNIIGDGKDKEKLQELASSLNLLNTSVFFHGLKSNDEVYQYILSSDFLVMNSNFETFSLICAEAISCGKPVVATRCGGPQEFITEETGMLIEPGNQQQLVHAMHQMISGFRNYSPEKLKQLARSKFSSEIIGEKFRNVYETLPRSR